MKRSDSKFARLASAGLILSIGQLALMTDALAQEAPAGAAGVATPSQAPEESVDTGEIIVTAQKRSESAQKVPISITALNTESLRAQSVTTVSDLMRVAPGFTTGRQTQASNARLNIRGIGGSGNTAVDPSVATFIDGIYVARSGAVLSNLYDVATVEVLRGPQGTLFGRNASAGTLSINTVVPGATPTGYLSAQVGAYGNLRAEGALTLPASDDLSVRIAGIADTFHGYARTAIGDKHYGGTTTRGARLTAKFTPGDAITWVVRADYLRVTGSAAAQIELLPDTLTPATIANFRTRLNGKLPDVVDPFDRRSNQFIQGGLDDGQYGVTSDLNVQLGNDWSVRLLQGYRDWDSTQTDADVLQTPLDFLTRRGQYRSKGQSHELQLTSPRDMFGGAFDFVTGLYYFRETYDIREAVGLGREFCPTLVPLIRASLAAPCAAGQQNDAIVYNFHQIAKSYAGYFQGTAHITDRLDLTLGARYTRDQKDATYVLFLNNPTVAFFRAPENTVLTYERKRPTWRANLAWRPTPTTMFFATYSTGYKAGGFNSATGSTALGQRRIFAPESSKNYEIGMKTTFLDRKLLLNATLYRTDVNGFQDRSFDGISTVISNAGALRQQGAEVEANVRIAPWLSFNNSVAYLDSKFLSYPNAAGLPAVGGNQSLKGKPNNYSPKWQGNSSLNLETPISGNWNFTARGDLSYISSQFVGAVLDGNPQNIQKGYALLGARIGVKRQDERLGFSVYGLNLTDKGYCTYIFQQTFDAQFGLRTPANGGTAQRCSVGAPRTYGIRVDYRW